MARKQISLGGWYRHSNSYAPNTRTTLFGVNSGGTTANSSEGAPIFAVRVANVSSSYVGLVLVDSHFNLEVYYFNAATFALTLIGTIVDPWPDPALGYAVYAQSWQDIPGRRLAAALKTSTYDEDTRVYATDGEIHLYDAGVEIWSATNLHFAHKNGHFQSELTKVTFGNCIAMDRIWVRNGMVAPNDSPDGAVPATADRLVYEDDGNLVGWTAWRSDPAALAALPYVIADVGSLNGIGYSNGTGAGTTPVGTGGTNARGMRQLVTLFEPPPPPDPPPVVVTACPVTLVPTPAGGGSACPVTLVP